MADFRKWLLAFAVIALVSSTAFGQATTALSCTANAGVPPLIRAEGIAEQVGDILITCTGGTPTPPNTNIPRVNITVTTTTPNITSRLTKGSLTEALLLVDEPHSATNPATPMLPCTVPPCIVKGVGAFVPVEGEYQGPYNGGETGYNVFQGTLTGANQITWLGVPFDPPGTTGNRTIRITNVRVDVSGTGVSTTPIPTQVTAFLTVNPPQSVPLSTNQLAVATVQPGLGAPSVTGAKPSPLVQCQDVNGDLFTDDSATGTVNFTVSLKEGFASSWKVRNVSQSFTDFTDRDWNQDVPGFIYSTESGIYVGGTEPPTNPPDESASVPGQENFPNVNGLPLAGRATQGTRLYASFGSVPAGTALYVPAYLPLYDVNNDGVQTGWAYLVDGADSNGAGGSPSVDLGTTGSIAFKVNSIPFSTISFAPVSISGGVGQVVYEVVRTDQTVLEAMDIPVVLSYVANVSQHLPATDTTATITTGFAPKSTVHTASSSAPIPRFVSAQTVNSFSINVCSCNILFPFVTNQLGYDTGIAIANTSMDPFSGHAGRAQEGYVTINYYGGTSANGTGTAPAPQKTNAVVPAGQQLLFSVGGGGNFGITATPNFQGYIIAQAEFQYCHAFAYINAFGASPTDQGASEGYLGIVLDVPSLQRTGALGEVQAH